MEKETYLQQGVDMQLDLTVEEVNLVLLALSKLPFDSVNQLIPKIQQQGQEQLEPKPEETKE